MARPLREFTRFIWWMQIERQAAANPQIILSKPTDLDCESTCRLPSSTPPLSLLSVLLGPKGWYSFYHSTEDRRLSRPRWLATYRDGLQAVTHLSTNRARRRVNYVDRDQRIDALTHYKTEMIQSGHAFSCRKMQLLEWGFFALELQVWVGATTASLCIELGIVFLNSYEHQCKIGQIVARYIGPRPTVAM